MSRHFRHIFDTPRLDRLAISPCCTDVLSTSSIQPFRSEQIDLIMITATNRYDNDHQSLFRDFIDQPMGRVAQATVWLTAS
jgi:hypothetical protein